MATTDYSNILTRFAELAKFTEEEAKTYEPTVKSAYSYFGRLLVREPEEGEVPLCEYACACKAFLDYTVLCAATAKTYSTQTGGIYARLSENDTVINAERLMKNAFASLPEGLIRDDGFVFECTEG